MSYLNRLIRRTQGDEQPQSLQPFVRSTSPIAEQDQRIGMANFEPNDFPVTELGTSQNWGEIDADQGTMTPELTTSQEVTVQRKLASPVNPSLPSISPAPPGNRLSFGNEPAAGVETNPNRSSEFAQVEPAPPPIPSNRPVEDLDQDQTTSPSLPIKGEPLNQEPEPVHLQPPGGEQQPSRPRAWRSETSAISEGIDPWQPTLEAEMTNPQNPQSETSFPTTVPLNPPLTLPKQNPSETQDGAQPSIPLNAVRPRLISSDFPRDVPPLEPSKHALADPDELPFAEATGSNTARQASPQVVIGRINVEVIPQTEVTPKSRSGPLTAASVSVIGSLGRGVSSNVRLSLRQR